jgi:hypothetical protein
LRGRIAELKVVLAEQSCHGRPPGLADMLLLFLLCRGPNFPFSHRNVPSLRRSQYLYLTFILFFHLNILAFNIDSHLVPRLVMFLFFLTMVPVMETNPLLASLETKGIQACIKVAFWDVARGGGQGVGKGVEQRVPGGRFGNVRSGLEEPLMKALLQANPAFIHRCDEEFRWDLRDEESVRSGGLLRG